ncbi:MAG: xylulokinase [Planctomycetota bacterium]
MAFLLGYDVGSSSVKAALLDARSGKAMGSAASPETELPISAPEPGWAEQDPHLWWEHLIEATEKLRMHFPRELEAVEAIGIAYQMHGLVLVDRELEVLRPAIIWCDSRSTLLGEKAASALGHETCLERFLNFPGNFTASKLAWVKENEPDLYTRIHKAMLPGDYIALRMTNEVRTTVSGLSEGSFWDYEEQGLARKVLDCFGIDEELLPDPVPCFSDQGRLTRSAARALGLGEGIPVAYRSGDQPNNALALNVMHPGEAAATAGTSGVVYGIADRPVHDPLSRVNTFVHVNHAPGQSRYGVLLCVNGTGILNSWMKNRILGAGGGEISYPQMNAWAAEAPVGAAGLTFLPFGNGAERTLENRDIGASLHGLNFNIHDRRHLMRAVQEGLVFALKYGLEIMDGMGLGVRCVRAGQANLFLSPLFRSAFATVTGAKVELFDTDGALGAARAAGLGAGIFSSPEEAFSSLKAVETIEPDSELAPAYGEAYARWLAMLGERLHP